MKPPAFVEENSSICGNGSSAFEKVFKARQSGFPRMHALDRLRELHLVTDKNDISCGTGHRNEISKGHLPGLIDDQIVIGLMLILAGEMKDRPADEAMRAGYLLRRVDG